MAILSTQEQQMTLNNIYKWIMANYAFYRFNTGGWQNSIRHNLSLNKAFTKIARRTDEPGKGMKWMIEPTEFDNFVQQGMKGCRRPNPMPGTQSTLGSPNSPVHLARAGANGAQRDDHITPPMNSYQPAYAGATEAYTPERGSNRLNDGDFGLGINGEGQDYDYVNRSTPRNGLTAVANAAGSPPALFVNDQSRVGTLDTPFPLRPTQRLAPPSTLRRPSDFIQFSSPAPFWKMEGLIGSTPWKPYDLSPLKTPFPAFKKNESDKKEDEEVEGEAAAKASGQADGEPVEAPKDKGSPVIPPSSPPVARSSSIALEASPTVSRPVTANAKTLNQATEPATKVNSQDTHAGFSNLAAAAQRIERPSSSAPTQHLSGPSPYSSTVQAPAAPPTKSSHLINHMPPQHDHQQPPPHQHQNHTHSNPNTNGYAFTPAPTTNGFQDDGEDEGIDLAK